VPSVGQDEYAPGARRPERSDASMNRRLPFLRVAAFCAIASCNGTAPAPLALQDLAGFWGREKYLAAVDSTRRANAETPEEIEIAQDSGRWIITWTNYHEADQRVIRSMKAAGPTDVYELDLGSSWDAPDSSFNPGSPPRARRIQLTIHRTKGTPTSLSFADSTLGWHPRETFVRMPANLERMVRRRLLAGSYVDGAGRTYTFADSGESTLPERPVKIEVSVDHIEAPFPYFMVRDSTRGNVFDPYGYVWAGDTLLLYAYDPGADAPIGFFSKPFAKLTRVR
jgi:hypothetical protein